MRIVSPPGGGGGAAPKAHKDVGAAIIDLDAATAGIFDDLIVTLCYHSEAMILGISRLRRVGVGWRKLPCVHMQCMSTLCIRKVAHVMCGPEGPRSIPKGSVVAGGWYGGTCFQSAQKAQKGRRRLLPSRLVPYVLLRHLLACSGNTLSPRLLFSGVRNYRIPFAYSLVCEPSSIHLRLVSYDHQEN